MAFIGMDTGDCAIAPDELIDTLPTEREETARIVDGHLDQRRFIEERIAINMERLEPDPCP